MTLHWGMIPFDVNLAHSRSMFPPSATNSFRSWNLFGAGVDQDLIVSQMSGMVDRSRMVGGKPMSLLDLGYGDVGLGA
jgi:hypothetical protein